jgi:protein-arginine kinase activator protein McsA
MFGNKKNFNDFLRALDDMYSQFDSHLGEWKSQTKVSEDGTMKITTYYRGDDLGKNKPTIEIQSLKKLLDDSIKNEDFEMAVDIRDQIKKLELNQETIKEIELELKKSILEQNFEKSIELRDKLKNLKK